MNEFHAVIFLSVHQFDLPIRHVLMIMIKNLQTYIQIPLILFQIVTKLCRRTIIDLVIERKRSAKKAKFNSSTVVVLLVICQISSISKNCPDEFIHLNDNVYYRLRFTVELSEDLFVQKIVQFNRPRQMQRNTNRSIRILGIFPLVRFSSTIDRSIWLRLTVVVLADCWFTRRARRTKMCPNEWCAVFPPRPTSINVAFWDDHEKKKQKIDFG